MMGAAAPKEVRAESTRAVSVEAFIVTNKITKWCALQVRDLASDEASR